MTLAAGGILFVAFFVGCFPSSGPPRPTLNTARFPSSGPPRPTLNTALDTALILKYGKPSRYSNLNPRMSQVHLREFYELNSRSHEVYEWARGVDLPDGTTPHLLFRNLSPEVQVCVCVCVFVVVWLVTVALPVSLSFPRRFPKGAQLSKPISSLIESGRVRSTMTAACTYLNLERSRPARRSR